MSELERHLVALGRELDVAAAPDLAPRVLLEIGARRQRVSRRRLGLAFAAVLLAALLAALAIPEARSALARLFNIGAVRVEVVDRLPELAPAEPLLEPTLGRRVTLADARESVSYELRELAEEPDSVYLDARETVWFLYGRPDAVRLLVAQTPSAEADDPFLLKKLASAGTAIRELRVRGQLAFLLSGEPHFVFLVDEDGESIGESARLARDVLIWTEGGQTMRLEGDLSEESALRIAESLRVRSRG